jgi:hypothetical protein
LAVPDQHKVHNDGKENFFCMTCSVFVEDMILFSAFPKFALAVISTPGDYSPRFPWLLHFLVEPRTATSRQEVQVLAGI